MPFLGCHVPLTWLLTRYLEELCLPGIKSYVSGNAKQTTQDLLSVKQKRPGPLVLRRLRLFPLAGGTFAPPTFGKTSAAPSRRPVWDRSQSSWHRSPTHWVPPPFFVCLVFGGVIFFWESKPPPICLVGFEGSQQENHPILGVQILKTDTPPIWP